jgi:hypothetical protein
MDAYPRISMSTYTEPLTRDVCAFVNVGAVGLKAYDSGTQSRVLIV